MKLQLATQTGQNLFTGYGAGYVMVNKEPYRHSLVVAPQRIIEDWRVASFDELEARHFEFLQSLGMEILLLGTGATLRFPLPALTRCLAAAGVGLEVMDTSAACRTYNILVAESRNVAAAVIVG